MDAGVKKDIWSLMEDFSKDPGGKDLNKMKAQYEMFMDAVGSKKHGDFTPAILKLPQATWIGTFVEDVTDKSTGQPLFPECLLWQNVSS